MHRAMVIRAQFEISIILSEIVKTGRIPSIAS
jgi:hypothetical protein